MYGLLLRVMFLLSPERIHHLVFGLIRGTTAVPPVRAVIRRCLAGRDPILEQEVFGVRFPAPVGLAAGFDKNARAVNGWGALGFGFAEIGTVTAHPQPGNPTPRLFRLPADKALVNRMGFNNYGSGAAANELRKREPGAAAVPIGANIGKTKVTPLEGAADDYRISAMLLGPLADFIVVNVSSPNTPGLRDLQATESLRPVLQAVLDTVTVPVLVKIAPDLADEDVDAVADLAVELGLAGIVATNTTISRAGLHSPAPRSKRSARAGSRATRSRHGRWRCSVVSRRGSGTTSCWSQWAASRASTTCTSASARARRSCRCTRSSSTAGRCGPAQCTSNSPRGCAQTASVRSPKPSASTARPGRTSR
ncbi:hypothetical protein MTP03_24110 [Tsukamurella sp. PLM1]|nr:hypothetical protein MTP03_24110 [Tsukamurella sp. PLM1]